jgi:hypothetical protein
LDTSVLLLAGVLSLETKDTGPYPALCKSSPSTGGIAPEAAILNSRGFLCLGCKKQRVAHAHPQAARAQPQDFVGVVPLERIDADAGQPRGLRERRNSL